MIRSTLRGPMTWLTRVQPGLPAGGVSSRWVASPSPAWSSAPPPAARRTPETAATAPARAVRAPPARRSSSPVSSGDPRRASTRSARRRTGRRRGGQSQLIYESLVRFNLIDGSLHPRPGQGAAAAGRPSTIELPLQDGTKWSDGSELTADDVVFTFELGKQTASSLLHRLELRRLASPPPTRARSTFKLKSRSVQPGLRQERPGQRHSSCPRQCSARSPRTRSPPTRISADRLRSVPARQVRPDPDQPEAERRLLGQGRSSARRR